MLFTGVGAVRAARSLEARLAEAPLPDLVVSSGFAGALSTALPLGAWVTAVHVAEWNGVERVLISNVELAPPTPGLVPCDVVSMSQLASSELAGANLVASGADGGPPLVVDMESAALAHEAARHGVPFAVVRLISDTPAHPLPAFLSPVTSALAATSAASRLAFAARGLRAALADPRGVVHLVRDGASWLRALEDGWRELGSRAAAVRT